MEPHRPQVEDELQASATMIAAVITHVGLGAAFGIFFSGAIAPLEGGWRILAAAILPAAFFVGLAAYAAWATAAHLVGAARRAARTSSLLEGFRWKGFEPPYPGSSLLVAVGAPFAAICGAILGALTGAGAFKALLWYLLAGVVHGAVAVWFVRTSKPPGALWGESEFESDGHSYREKDPPRR